VLGITIIDISENKVAKRINIITRTANRANINEINNDQSPNFIKSSIGLFERLFFIKQNSTTSPLSIAISTLAMADW